MQKRTKRPVPLVTIVIAVAAIVGFVGHQKGWDFDYRHYGILLILFFVLSLMDRQRVKRRMAEALVKGDYAYALEAYERELPKLVKKNPKMAEHMKLNMGICHLNMGDLKEAESILTNLDPAHMEAAHKALHGVYLSQAYLLQKKQPARAMKLLMEAKAGFFMKGSEAILALAAASLNQFEDAKGWLDQAKENATTNQVGGFKGYLTPDVRLERMLYQFYIGAAYDRMGESGLRDQWWAKLDEPGAENAYSKAVKAWKAEQ